MTLTLRMNQTEQPNIINRSQQPITTDLHQLSLSANNITAKTGQSVQTNLTKKV